MEQTLFIGRFPETVDLSSTDWTSKRKDGAFLYLADRATVKFRLAASPALRDEPGHEDADRTITLDLIAGYHPIAVDKIFKNGTDGAAVIEAYV